MQAPGTYLGLIEKLDYLKSLGVNAIELLPVFEFNELEYYSPIPGSPTNEHRFNFWGYSTGGSATHTAARTLHAVSHNVSWCVSGRDLESCRLVDSSCCAPALS